MQIKSDWLTAPKTHHLMNVLSQDGYHPYFVGGCVRNALLGVAISDIDISTDATPEVVIKLAEAAGFKALPTGIDHGTITVIVEADAFEVTTFRKDVATDGRRAVVEFSTDMLDDAKRRDFTMNAIYADIDGTVIDPLNGLPDLKARKVRFILDPDQRIAEDYLRILRFFRFHSYYGDPDAGMDADAVAACAMGADGIDSLSKERIGAEMVKILASKNPAPVIATMQKIGVLARILPGTDAKYLPILIHLEENLVPCWLRRLAVLGGENHTQNLRMAKKDATTLKTILSIIENGGSVKQAAYKYGANIARSAHLVLSALMEQETLPNVEALIKLGDSAQGKFPVKAKDLPNLAGFELGQKLAFLEKEWIDSGFEKIKQELLEGKLT